MASTVASATDSARTSLNRAGRTVTEHDHAAGRAGTATPGRPGAGSSNRRGAFSGAAPGGTFLSMWDLLAGPFLAAGGLLVVAGLPKLRDPLPLVRALHTTRLPAHGPVVRALALAEVVLGVAAVLAPGRLTAALVAVAYAGFTTFVAVAVRRGGVLASCGCFGRPDTPPTRAHLVLTGGATATAAALAVSPPGTTVWSGATPGSTAALAGFAALLGALAYLVLAVLPTTTATAVRGLPKG
jgi:hypothetical protein